MCNGFPALLTAAAEPVSPNLILAMLSSAAIEGLAGGRLRPVAGKTPGSPSSFPAQSRFHTTTVHQQLAMALFICCRFSPLDGSRKSSSELRCPEPRFGWPGVVGNPVSGVRQVVHYPSWPFFRSLAAPLSVRRCGFGVGAAVFEASPAPVTLCRQATPPPWNLRELAALNMGPLAGHLLGGPRPRPPYVACLSRGRYSARRI